MMISRVVAHDQMTLHNRDDLLLIVVDAPSNDPAVFSSALSPYFCASSTFRLLASRSKPLLPGSFQISRTPTTH